MCDDSRLPQRRKGRCRSGRNEVNEMIVSGRRSVKEVLDCRPKGRQTRRVSCVGSYHGSRGTSHTSAPSDVETRSPPLSEVADRRSRDAVA
jgi:hypothetical protein